jgi:lipopolysaccharide transport system ATP-binding protein
MSTVIQIENLWKEYRLGVIGHGTLTHDLQSWWAKFRGKEDPNSKIQPLLSGQEQQIDGNHFWALQDINIEIKEGELIGIVGKNGAGKSTLLKILSRITAPTKGQIKIKGRISSLLEVGTGFHPELTGRENVFMNGAILGMSKQEIKSKLDEIIDFSGVEQFIDTPVKRYSSGMYVRLAFAVAAHLEPEILILDEVLAVGDPDFQKKCLGKMGEVSKSGRTIIFVSHNMPSIKYLCKRVIFLAHGSVVTSGDPEYIIEKYLENIISSKNSSYADWGAEGIGDDYIRLFKAGIKNPDDEYSVIHNIDSPVTVEMEYSISNRYDKDIATHFWFYDRYGNCLFIVYDHPYNDDYKKKNPGRYKSTCSIPAYLLNRGEYYIDVYITNPEKKEKHIFVKQALSFKIREKINRQKNVEIPGFFRMNFPWKFKCLEEY